MQINHTARKSILKCVKLKFGCEMLYNAENIALQSSQILYNFPHAIQKYTKFARLYLVYFTTFRNQTLQF
jgi:hypothetical protein